MSEEIKEEIKEEKKLCCCKELKMFLLAILASFLGSLVALCIFSAAMKPQLPPPMPMKMHKSAQFGQFEHGKFERHQKFNKKFKGQRYDANRQEFRGKNNGADFDSPTKRPIKKFENDD